MTTKEQKQIKQITKAFYKMQDLCDKQAAKIETLIETMQNEIAPKTASGHKDTILYNNIYEMLDALKDAARIDFEDMPNDIQNLANDLK